MKALIKDKPGEGYTLKEVPVPTPKEGELLVKSHSVGICGSDIFLYKWMKGVETIASTPFTPGHEASGMVVACGEGTRLKIG